MSSRWTGGHVLVRHADKARPPAVAKAIADVLVRHKIARCKDGMLKRPIDVERRHLYYGGQKPHRGSSPH